MVVDLVDRRAERKEQRQHYDADDDRIDAEPRVDDIGDIGPRMMKRDARC